MKKSKNKKRIVFLILFVSFGFIALDGITSEADALKITYGYGGKFGPFGIADTAKAYLNNDLIAKARAIEIIQKNPGPNVIKIKETHYSNGSTIYTGYLYIRFGFRGGSVVREESISGKKRFSVFGGWPAGY